MGLYGGNNIACSAPYQSTTTCVNYAPTGIHAGLDTNIAPTENIKAIALNFDYHSLPDTVATTTG
ncbi:hypothetical protein [Chryseobacterium limigenitum]|uniref:Uncharacterized protein n=1 Tax=Chryseobacterium limigenitum TaxID=1612149 RepID=A0A1K2IU54_9FLAO|nr:hypothetical protein [Chryseobacterium limigenitum]SFZ95267.1 hypothetical protein SAMN05216324_10930 [Chryseobacterium limigenitum]